MEIQTIILIGTSILSGASLILKYIVPLTQNTIDDEVYQWILKILKVVSQDSNYGEQIEVKLSK